MAAEKPADSGGMPPEIRQHAEALRHLAGQDLGVLGAGYGVLPEGGNGLVMMVEEGMPDELKDILAGALPGVNISFLEMAEPELYAGSVTREAGAETSPDRRTPPRSIAEIRAVDHKTQTTGRELIRPEEARERNLQNAVVEVLAHAGIPFETAFEVADVAWDIHVGQMDRRDQPDEPVVPREKTPEELEAQQRWEAMTPEEHEAESRAVWETLEAQPGFHKSMRKATADFEHGRYFSGDILDHSGRIPKLKVVKKSEAVRKWGELERRIPNFKERMTQARQDLIDGKGSVLMEDGSLVPLQEYKAQADSQTSEQVLIDNTPTTN